MALEQQVLKLLPAERASTVLNLLDAFCISPVFSMGQVVDRHRFARRSRDEFENGGLALVMGNEELATSGAGITLALVVIPKMDAHGFGLAFDNNNGGLAPRCGVNNNVSPRAFSAMLSLPFLIHLLKRVAVVVVKVLNKFLADPFFGCGFAPASFEGTKIYRCPGSGCGPASRTVAARLSWP